LKPYLQGANCRSWNIEAVPTGCELPFLEY
jgi:hypothetical protein